MIARIIKSSLKFFEKPITVTIFRLCQEFKLIKMLLFNEWKLITRNAKNIKVCPSKPVILNNCVPELTPKQCEKIKSDSDKILAYDFCIHGSPVPQLEKCDYSEDWRYAHKWPSLYFKRYNFYEKKKIPYDVKIPWELSRFGFLIPLMAGQVVGNLDKSIFEWIYTFLARWEKMNPIAWSINWYPMESSMRIINLILLLDLITIATSSCNESEVLDVKNELTNLISKMLYENLCFVWVTREYTDVRGNHFVANIVALFLGSKALLIKTPEVNKWSHYAHKWIEKEIRLQFHKDGVNFEKACGYHKLVLELLTLAAVVADRSFEPFSDDCLEILEKGAKFSDAITRPDGLAANFGDNDDSCCIPFILEGERRH